MNILLWAMWKMMPKALPPLPPSTVVSRGHASEDAREIMLGIWESSSYLKIGAQVVFHVSHIENFH